MATMRSKEMTDRYNAVRAERGADYPCPLCSIPSVQEFTHWRIVQNGFSYDLVADVHHMVVPKRHVIESEVTKEEWTEYNQIKHTYVQQKYDVIMEGTYRQKSIPKHFHIHLISLHEE